MIDFLTITPAQSMTLPSLTFYHPAKNALSMRFESSNADFCLTCLCIYDKDGGCMCTKYARNSSGDYVKNHVPESSK